MYSVQQTSNNNEEGIDLKKVILFFINKFTVLNFVLFRGLLKKEVEN